MPNANPSSAITSAVEDVRNPPSAPTWGTHGVRLYSRAAGLARVAPDDPAVRIVTDFAQHEPRTISPEQCIEDALREMVCAAVRALLVVRNALVVGLITAYDIERRAA